MTLRRSVVPEMSYAAAFDVYAPHPHPGRLYVRVASYVSLCAPRHCHPGAGAIYDDDVYAYIRALRRPIGSGKQIDLLARVSFPVRGNVRSPLEPWLASLNV